MPLDVVVAQMDRSNQLLFIEFKTLPIEGNLYLVL